VSAPNREIEVTDAELREMIRAYVDALSPVEIEMLANTREVKLEAVAAARIKLGWPVVGVKNGRPFMIK
jgi:hypothetical protein